MAEKKPAASYESIMKALRNREYAPVYILMGEESYYIDRISDYIADSVLRPEERDFNQTIIFGADVTGIQVVDAAKGFPMMAERRVIIVKEAQALKGTDALEKYFEKPVPTTILVICHKNGTIDRRKKLVSKAEAVGVVFESKKMRDYELPGFVESYLATKGATIDRKAATMVAEHIGSDLNRLTSELDKVLIALPDGEKRITPEVVERQIGVSKDFNAFELRNAIIEKNVFKANQIVNYFDKNPKAGSLYAFLPILFNYFQNLMIAYYAPQKNNEQALAQYMELRGGWAAREYMTGLRNSSGLKVLQIISKLREVDARSKGLDNPSTGAGDLMKELIFFILH